MQANLCCFCLLLATTAFAELVRYPAIAHVEDPRSAYPLASLEQRQIIRLKNPLLPAQTPIKDARLWYYPQ